MTASGWILATLLLAAAVGGLAVLHRRAARREEKFLRAVEDACRRRGTAILSTDPLVIGRDGRRLTLSRSRLLRLGTEPADAVAEGLRSLIDHPVATLEGGLNLKIHGPRLAPRLRDSVVFELLPQEPSLALGEIPGLTARVAYTVEGDLGRCVTIDHLTEAGIDRRDLHGIALAVARQSLDEEHFRQAVARGSAERLDLESDRAASWLLVGGDFLARGESLELVIRGARRRAPKGEIADQVLAVLTPEGIEIR